MANYYDDWDTNPDNNTAPAPNGAPTGVYPGTNVAQTIRLVMAAIKQLFNAVASLAGAQFTGNVTIGTTDENANLTVHGATTLDGAVGITNGGLTVGSATTNENLGVNGNVAITGTLSVTETASFSNNVTASRATGRVFGIINGPYLTYVNANNDSRLQFTQDGWRLEFLGATGRLSYKNNSSTELFAAVPGGDFYIAALGAGVAATRTSDLASLNSGISAARSAVACTLSGLTEVGPVGEGNYMNLTGSYVMRDIRITTSSDTTTYYARVVLVNKPAV